METPLMAIGLIIAIYIIISEGKLWHNNVQKSQTILLKPELEYYYTVANGIPLMASNFFYNHELFPKIISFQNANKNNTEKF